MDLDTVKPSPAGIQLLCGMTDHDRRLLGARLVRTFAAEGVEILGRFGDVWHMVKGKTEGSEHIKNDVRVQDEGLSPDTEYQCG